MNQSVLILETTDRKADRTAAAVQVGVAAKEEQVAGIGAVDCAGPVVAVAACEAERTVVAEAITRRNKLKR